MIRKKTVFTLKVALAICLLLWTHTAHALLYEEISGLELYQRLTDKTDRSYVVLDIRTPLEYDQGHITGAVNIPLKDLGIRYYELDKTKDIIVYCAYGLQSKVACQILTNLGFKDVYNLTGGLEAWNYSLESSYKSTSI